MVSTRVGPARTLSRSLISFIPATIGIVFLSSTLIDDCHITFWAAQTLSTLGEILNFNGDRVEQSSSLLHVVVLSGLAKLLPLYLPTISVLVSIACSVAVVLLTQSLAAEVDPQLSFAAGAITALSAGLVYWSVSGLETTLAASLGLGGLLAVLKVVREGWSPKIVLIVAAALTAYLLARPESIFIVTAVLVGSCVLVVVRRRFVNVVDDGELQRVAKSLAQCLALAMIAFGAIVAFRLLYFGAAFPQPVTAKAAGLTATALTRGASYVGNEIVREYAFILVPLAICGAASVIYRAASKPQFSAAAVVVALFAIAQTAFIVLAGGDWMPGGRFLVPVVPAIAILALLFAQQVVPKRMTPICVVLIGLQIAAISNLPRPSTGLVGGPLWRTWQLHREVPVPATWFETINDEQMRHLHVVPVLDQILRTTHRPDGKTMTLMTCQMGIMPFYLNQKHYGQIKYVDICALTTRDFTDCPQTAWLPKSFYGIRLSFSFFFDRLEQIQNRCGIDAPDIMFALEPPARRSDAPLVRDLLAKRGYNIVFGNSANEIIALKRDLVVDADRSTGR